MSARHVSASDTAVLPVVRSGQGAEPPLSVLVLTAAGTVSRHRVATTLVVGREASCDLVLPDDATSRRHARLVPHPATIEIIDLDSRNGTFVDGHPAARAMARTGSVVRIGSFHLLVVKVDELGQASDASGPLVGGPAIAPVRRTVGLVGPTALPVLILGETGTGKDVVARLIHESSMRSGAYVAVNCAALPEHLVESELFGHVRGAFTGADKPRRGLLSLADGGTLFLDEVGDLPLPAQAKLLRVLEDGMVRPVGAEHSTRVEVRFLSATNRDLHLAVAEGRFRRDLLARLGAVEIRLPPLRERREDLPVLIRFLAQRAGLAPLQLSTDALEALLLHGWPNNIRELDNLVRTTVLRGSAIDLADLPTHLQAQLREARRQLPAKFVSTDAGDLKARVVDAMRSHAGNVRRVAAALGVARGHLYRIMRRLEIEPAAFRKPGTRDANGEDQRRDEH